MVYNHKNPNSSWIALHKHIGNLLAHKLHNVCDVCHPCCLFNQLWAYKTWVCQCLSISVHWWRKRHSRIKCLIVILLSSQHFQAYELSTLTGTQVLLLVASETGHVYTFATRKLQPMITSETGKALIQTCLNSPDSPPRTDPSTDQRMSATGFEETDLTYQVSEADGLTEPKVHIFYLIFSII